MHLGAAPIDQNGHLNAKKMFNKSFLTTMQKELPEKLKAAGFDIEKGRSGGTHLSKRQWQQATKDANDQVTLTMAHILPNGSHSVDDAGSRSQPWGTSTGLEQLRERPLDVNTSALDDLATTYFKTVKNITKTSQDAKESADKAKAAADAERKALAVKQKQLLSLIHI